MWRISGGETSGLRTLGLGSAIVQPAGATKIQGHALAPGGGMLLAQGKPETLASDVQRTETSPAKPGLHAGPKTVLPTS